MWEGECDGGVGRGGDGGVGRGGGEGVGGEDGSFNCVCYRLRVVYKGGVADRGNMGNTVIQRRHVSLGW